MKSVLEWALSSTGSPLISLMVLSIAVSIGSLPLYHMAESWQDKERETQKKLKPKISEFKAVFRGSALNSYISTLYRQNGYHPAFAIRASFGLLIQIPFFFAAYHLLSNYSAFNGVTTALFKDLGKPDSLLSIGSFSANIMPLLMTAVNIGSAMVYGKKTSFKEQVQLYGMALLFLIVLYNSTSALLFYWTCNNIFAFIKNVVYLFIYKDGAITKREKDPELLQKLFKFIPDSSKETDKIFRLAAAAFTILTFISVPLAVLSSGSSSDFEEALSHYFYYLSAFSFVFFTAAVVIYYIFSKKARTILCAAALFLLLYGLINTFAFAGNYGDMSHFVFNEELEIEMFEILLNIFSGVILAGTVFLLLKKWPRFLRPALSVIIISLILFSINESFAYKDKRTNILIAQIDLKDNNYTFSKTEKNVVIIMLDRFIGGYMPKILELMPELGSDLDGFVYYRNSLSQASYTIGGVPPILGGWDYNVHNANLIRTDVPLLKKLDESSRILPYNFDKSGYGVKIYRTDCINWFDKSTNWVDENNKEYIGNTQFIEPDYPKYREMWLQKNEKESGNDDTLRKKLLAFGLFRASPLFVREFIYDKGEWHIESDVENEENYEKPDEKKFVIANQKSKYRRDTTLKYYAALDFLPEMSRVLEEGKGQFIFLSNNLTHEPHSINSDFEFEITGKVTYPRSVFNKFHKSLTAVRHLYTDAAALRLVNKWIQWMKDNGVYDNTRIIIVSDHGRDVYNPFFKQQRIPNTRKKAHPSYYNNLLLVKDFDSQGELRTENEFMTSADVPALAVKDIIPDAVNPYTGKKIEMPKNKFPFYIYDVQWRVEKQDKFKYRYHEKYVVEKFEDIDSPSKWRRL
ncbi:MAG TPA: YidC/Oxa1 family membrane protein insertase, partial [bacterium]|nr:YidC/Oxa1 family membrane protein insertase [bacterium]